MKITPKTRFVVLERPDYDALAACRRCGKTSLSEIRVHAGPPPAFAGRITVSVTLWFKKCADCGLRHGNTDDRDAYTKAVADAKRKAGL